jgi:phosphatidylinositol glycan class C protein
MDLLAEMELNPSLYNYQINEIVMRSARVTFQISACVVFFASYHYMKNGKLAASPVIAGCWIFTTLGNIIFQLNQSWGTLRSYRIWEFAFLLFPRERLQVTLFYLFASYSLAPMLRALTETISTDTIHAVSIVLTFTHLLTHDYGVDGFFVSKTVSMNAAIISAVCLASRLPTDELCIGLITLAVVVLILFPIFGRILWDSALFLVFVIGSVGYLCFLISTHFFLLYLAVISCVTVLVPLLFVTSQKFKKNLYGPWDEAVVEKSRIS